MSDLVRPHIVSLVMNGVVGDSRVLKTAKAAEAAGYRATLVGTGTSKDTVSTKIEGVNVVLVPNLIQILKAEKNWTSHKVHSRAWAYAESALTLYYEQIEKLKPDLVHSHDMFGLRVGAGCIRRLAANGKVVPWVHDLHEYVCGLTHIAEDFRALCEEYERRYLTQADHLITVSDALALKVSEIHKLKQLPTVVFNAPWENSETENAPDIRSDLGLAPSTHLAIYIGGAKKERGCETLLRAIATRPNVHLCFLSQGNYVDELALLAKKLGLKERLHIRPYVASDQVVSYIRTATVGLHGLIHYPNGEVAMPNKLFEYMQAGIPVVVSDVAEMKKFVNAHSTGCVFEAENAASCANAIQSVINDRKFYADNITGDLKSEYSWQAQSRKLAKIYRNLLDQAQSKRALLLYPGAVDVSAVMHIAGIEIAEIDTGWVGPASPDWSCDFYADPTVPGDKSGLLSLIASKYHTIITYGPSEWPVGLDHAALSDAGVKLEQLNHPLPRVADPNLSRFHMVEKAYLSLDSRQLLQTGMQEKLNTQTVNLSDVTGRLKAIRNDVALISKNTDGKKSARAKAQTAFARRFKGARKQLKTLRGKLHATRVGARILRLLRRTSITGGKG
ncbi:glycosyltransferase family 4 protein [Aureimonas fodinaquatilis]|uniref:Glycosyltransferase family 4 protein n=1 Tax=Aureimonas fodinaquatilis TaxID=2565783 RepID=A0A5B0E1N5_9HYPH|nr:glycosyltransferase family 4 protein [Aureimonas fodinaquatilis]KAA0971881.1 glycosyltransferase family 4 protein [Aureimonas fodinaquatilis]